jgi:hypothetical protein
VVVAAEVLVEGSGIGYFAWNERNNLSIANSVSAIGRSHGCSIRAGVARGPSWQALNGPLISVEGQTRRFGGRSPP